MEAKLSIDLPYIIPFKDGYKIRSGYNNSSIGTVTYQIEFSQQEIYLSEDDESDNYIKSSYTQLKVIYTRSEKSVPANFHEFLRIIIYDCLFYINNFLTSLRIKLNLNYISNINIAVLPDYLDILVNGDFYQYITSPMKLIKEQEVLSLDDLKLTQENISFWELNPKIALVEHFYSNARYSLESENFIYSIIELQISFEIFIGNTMSLLIYAKGRKQDKSDNELKNEVRNKEKVPLKLLIEKHLSSLLGENLNFEANLIVNNWRKKLYDTRNRIVHGGDYYISSSEAREAHDSYVEIRNYITNILINKLYITKSIYTNLKLFDDIFSNPSTQEYIQENLRLHDLISNDILFSDD